jgi:hypothetical protein
MEATNMSANEWAGIISEYSSMEPQKVPKEYKTAKELSEIWGLSATATKCRLRWAIESKKVETKKFRIPTGEKVYLTSHYKIIKK